MEFISLGINILFAVLLVAGFLVGFKRGFKRSLVRTIWLVVIMAVLIFISAKITNFVMNINLNITYNGENCGTINNYLVATMQSEMPIEGVNYLSIIELLVALINMVLNVVIFFLLYFVAKWISLPLYWISNAFIFAKERRMKRRAKKEKQKFKIKKYRLAGGLVGMLIGLISFCVIMTPVIGYVNIAKTIEKQTVNDENKGILTNTLGDNYTKIINQYDNTVPMKVLSTVKVDSLLNSLFDGLSTIKIGNEKITLSKEVSTGIKIYNELGNFKDFDIDTASKSKLDTILTSADNIVDTVFDLKIVSASWDTLVPFGVKIAKNSVDTTNMKSYTANLVDAVFDCLDGFDSKTTKSEFKSVIGIIRVLNNSDLLLPLIQDENLDKVNHLQTKLTSSVANELMGKIFEIHTVNSLAPAVVNFLLGYGAESLNYEYGVENSISAQALEDSAKIIVESAVDIISTYNESSATKVAINKNTVSAFGSILDQLKNILSEDNFENVVNSVEPKINNMIGGLLESQPQFMKNVVNGVVNNISEISNYKTSFVELFEAYDELKTQLDESKVDDNYNVQSMNFRKLGKAFDMVQNNDLMQNDLFLNTLHDALEYYLQDFEKQFSTESKSFEFTFDTTLLNNITALKTDNTEWCWETEFEICKDTVGVFVNLFKKDTEVSVIDKLKNPSDSSLEDLGIELDTSLKDSKLFGDVDRDLVYDLLTIADLNYSGDNADLSTMLGKAKDNVLDTNNVLTWQHELNHLKSLISIDLNNSNDSAILVVADTIDSIVFGTENIPASKIFTKSIINEYIVSYMDDVFGEVPQGNDFYKTINTIKNGFTTKNINSYRSEIEALIVLKDMKNIVDGEFEFKDDADALGFKIDEALKVGVVDGSDCKVIVTKQLVNDYLKNYIYNNVSIAGDFSSVITNIIGNKAGDNFSAGRIDTMTNTYEVEFYYLAQLMKVSETFGSVSVDAINNSKTIDGVSVTLAECFDGSANVPSSLKNSQLVGDSLINVFTPIFNQFIDDIKEGKDSAYLEIIDEIDFNYNDADYGIKDYIVWIGNRNINWDNINDYPTYTQLINSVVDINKYVNSESDNYIAEISLEKLESDASTYETTLDELQNGILMSTNATNRLLKIILTDIAELIEFMGENQASNYINQYLKFLDGTIVEYNGSAIYTSAKNAYIPYNVDNSILVYADQKDADANTWSFGISDSGELLLNNPFTTIKTLLNEGV